MSQTGEPNTPTSRRLDTTALIAIIVTVIGLIGCCFAGYCWTRYQRFQSIRPGMTKAQVSRLIGKPLSAGKTDCWQYGVRLADGTTDTVRVAYSAGHVCGPPQPDRLSPVIAFDYDKPSIEARLRPISRRLEGHGEIWRYEPCWKVWQEVVLVQFGMDDKVVEVRSWDD